MVYQAVPFDEYRAFGFTGADDLGNMCQYYHDFEAEFCAARDVAFSHQLNPKLQGFATWLDANKNRIPIQ